jgi:hypothetical protein
MITFGLLRGTHIMNFVRIRSMVVAAFLKCRWAKRRYRSAAQTRAQHTEECTREAWVGLWRCGCNRADGVLRLLGGCRCSPQVSQYLAQHPVLRRAALGRMNNCCAILGVRVASSTRKAISMTEHEDDRLVSKARGEPAAPHGRVAPGQIPSQ